MTERDFAKALLQGERTIDVRTLTDRILRRDHRRIWFLGIVCVIAWMAVVMLPWATVLPLVAKLTHQEYDIPRPTTLSLYHHSEALIEVMKAVIITFLDSIACMFIAAICTVSLIIFSRRATLRQVNARLADIAEQLKKQEKP
jgi:ABC-type Fe3+ transport system permease subunit